MGLHDKIMKRFREWKKTAEDFLDRMSEEEAKEYLGWRYEDISDEEYRKYYSLICAEYADRKTVCVPYPFIEESEKAKRLISKLLDEDKAEIKVRGLDFDFDGSYFANREIKIPGINRKRRAQNLINRLKEGKLPRTVKRITIAPAILPSEYDEISTMRYRSVKTLLDEIRKPEWEDLQEEAKKLYTPIEEM